MHHNRDNHIRNEPELTMEYRVIVKETVTKMVFVEAPTEPEAGLRVLRGEGTILKVHTTDLRVEDVKDIASSEQPFYRM
jgi:hypothetical protein